jgi:hypothetical protein
MGLNSTNLYQEKKNIYIYNPCNIKDSRKSRNNKITIKIFQKS